VPKLFEILISYRDFVDNFAIIIMSKQIKKDVHSKVVQSYLRRKMGY
jgi:hypothetical protein